MPAPSSRFVAGLIAGLLTGAAAGGVATWWAMRRAPGLACPEGAEPTGLGPPQGTRQWCQRLGPDDDFVRHGPWRRWFESGLPREQGEYLDGEKHGRWTRWYATGQKAQEGVYERGHKVGKWLQWGEDGRVWAAVDHVADGGVGESDAGPVVAAAGPDGDGDGVTDARDVCPFDADPAQDDTDRDGAGDACDDDLDGDEVANVHDNCPRARNWDQIDTDLDGRGDACDDAPAR